MQVINLELIKLIKSIELYWMVLSPSQTMMPPLDLTLGPSCMKLSLLENLAFIPGMKHLYYQSYI